MPAIIPLTIRKWLIGLVFGLLLAIPIYLEYSTSKTDQLDRKVKSENALNKFGFFLTEVSKESGVEFKHLSPILDSQFEPILPQIASMGASVSVCDFNRDGWNGRSIKLELSEERKQLKQVWKSSYLAAEQGDVVLLGDRLYGADVANKSFNCVDWESGRLLYKITRNSKPNRIATVSADSLLYCYSGDGYLYLVKPLEDRFETRGKIAVPGDKKYHYSHPVIHKKRLYIRHDNAMYVYNIAAS